MELLDGERRSVSPIRYRTRLSQDNQIKQIRARLLLGWVPAEQSCSCKQPACPAVGGGSEVTFKLLVPSLNVRKGFLALTPPSRDELVIGGRTKVTRMLDECMRVCEYV
ncbi:hypothetical protein J6590_036341 [Homalodisca vitripennis]|nr:hypothetical protein J6590_036341 [Homalodisca vitripennis]